MRVAAVSWVAFWRKIFAPSPPILTPVIRADVHNNRQWQLLEGTLRGKYQALCVRLSDCLSV